MPIYNTINTANTNGGFVKVLVWKITESVAELSHNLFLTSKSLTRLSSMKSEVHKKGYLSIRKLLLECSLLDKELVYDLNGKPFLKNGMHISITHSHHFAAIAISNHDVGIDIEQQRLKIGKISRKFCSAEFDYLQSDKTNFIQKLTTIWCAKEAVFKIENQKGISFKEHLAVKNFDENDAVIYTTLMFQKQNCLFEMKVTVFENFVMVYGYKI